MTKDSVLVECGAVVHYQITDVEKCYFASQNLDHQMRATARDVTARHLGILREAELQDSRTINKNLKVYC